AILAASFSSIRVKLLSCWTQQPRPLGEPSSPERERAAPVGCTGWGGLGSSSGACSRHHSAISPGRHDPAQAQAAQAGLYPRVPNERAVFHESLPRASNAVIESVKCSFGGRPVSRRLVSVPVAVKYR